MSKSIGGPGSFPKPLETSQLEELQKSIQPSKGVLAQRGQRGSIWGHVATKLPTVHIFNNIRDRILNSPSKFTFAESQQESTFKSPEKGLKEIGNNIASILGIYQSYNTELKGLSVKKELYTKQNDFEEVKNIDDQIKKLKENFNTNYQKFNSQLPLIKSIFRLASSYLAESQKWSHEINNVQSNLDDLIDFHTRENAAEALNTQKLGTEQSANEAEQLAKETALAASRKKEQIKEGGDDLGDLIGSLQAIQKAGGLEKLVTKDLNEVQRLLTKDLSELQNKIGPKIRQKSDIPLQNLNVIIKEINDPAKSLKELASKGREALTDLYNIVTKEGLGPTLFDNLFKDFNDLDKLT